MEARTESLERQHELRLVRLLQEVDKELGRGRAAEELGVDRKTLWRCMAEGRLTPRLAEALERLMLSREASAVDKLTQRMDGMEKRLEAWAEGDAGRRRELASMIEDTVRDAAQALREEWAGETRELEARFLGRLGAGRDHVPAVIPVWERSDGAGVRLRREYPELVTVEPAPDDPEVFGDAWDSIREWREIRKDHPNRGRSMSWLETEERIRELEVLLLEEHGMTLPPERYPLRGMARDSQLSWRRKALHDTRKRRARREVLGWMLTLGLWRGYPAGRAAVMFLLQKTAHFGAEASGSIATVLRGK